MWILSFIGNLITGFLAKMFTTPAVTTEVKTHEANIKTDPKRDDALNRLRGSL